MAFNRESDRKSGEREATNTKIMPKIKLKYTYDGKQFFTDHTKINMDCRIAHYKQQIKSKIHDKQKRKREKKGNETAPKNVVNMLWRMFEYQMVHKHKHIQRSPLLNWVSCRPLQSAIARHQLSTGWYTAAFSVR